jgi:hypothetical protein
MEEKIWLEGGRKANNSQGLELAVKLVGTHGLLATCNNIHSLERNPFEVQFQNRFFGGVGLRKNDFTP